MVKTIVTPQDNNYNLTIPANYIGRKIEILLYAIDEVVEEKNTARKKPSDFFGTLTQEEGEKFHNYILQARNEWDRNI
jgi:hypothetical protein